jgi:hypothetical protein
MHPEAQAQAMSATYVCMHHAHSKSSCSAILSRLHRMYCRVRTWISESTSSQILCCDHYGKRSKSLARVIDAPHKYAKSNLFLLAFLLSYARNANAL